MNPLKFPLVATSALLFFSALPLVAGNLYWDTNSGSAGIQGGNGNWDTSNYWKPNSDGSGTAQNWTDSDNAFFSVGSSTVSLQTNTYNVTALTSTGGITVTLSSGTINLGGGYTSNANNVANTLNATLVLTSPQTFTFNGTGVSTVQGTLNIGSHALTINATGNNRGNISSVLHGTADITISTDNTLGKIETNNQRYVQFTGNTANFTGDYIIEKGVMGRYSGSGYTNKNVLKYANTADGKEFYIWASDNTFGGLNSNGGGGEEYVSLGGHSNRTITIDTSVTGGGFDFAGALRELYAGKILSLTKTGAGAQGFSGTNTLTGNILITGGTLQIGNGGTTGSFTGINAITNNATLTINRSNDFSQSTDLNGKAITGSGSVTQAGSGALILDVANTYTGGTTITGGTLVIGHTTGASNGTITQTNDGSLLKFDTTGTVANNMSVYNVASNQTVTLSGNTTTNNATYDVATGTTLTVSGTIGGSGSVTMNGLGTLALSAANDFGGALLVNTGTVVLTGANAYSGGTTVSGGTLQIGAGSTTGSATGTLSTQGSGVLEFNRSDATTISNTLAGNGTFRQIGGNTLTLDGTNTTNGTIAVTSGTILFSGANALPVNGSLSATAGGTLSVADGTTRNSTLAEGLTMAGGNFVFDINSTAGDYLTFSGAASLSGTNVVKLNLSNATSSTWTLMTAASGMNGGTWSLDTDSFDTSGLTWTLTSNATTLTLSSSAATNLYYWTGNTSSSWGVADNWSSDSAGTSPRGSAPSAADDLFFTADTAGNLATTLGADFTVNTISITHPGVSIAAGNTLTANATSALAFNITANSGTTTLAANLAGANAGLTKSGDGSLTLSGSNTYGGATTISGGHVTVSGGSAIADTGTVVLSNAAGVQFTISTSETIGSLQGGGASGGNVTIGSGQTLTVAETGTSTFSGILGGAGSLVKSGAGTMVLDAENTYTGVTTISAGTLQIGSGNATGSIASTSGITNNGVLAFNRSDTFTVSQAISGSGGFVQLGSGTIVLTAGSDYTGSTTISAGTLQIGNGGTTGSIASTSGISNNGDLVVNRSDAITVSQAISGSGSLTKLGAGTLVLSGNNSYTGTRTLAAGTLQLDHANAIGTTGNVTFTGGTLAYTANNTADISSRIVSSSSAITIDTNGQNATYATGLAASNSGGLVKNGSGTLVLTGANTYTGGTTINAGTLQIGNGGATGSLGNYSMTNNGTLVFNTSSNVSIGAVIISGTGDVIQNGSGLLNLDHVGRYHGTGNFIINNGSVFSRRTDGFGSSSSLVVNAGSLQLSGNFSVAGVTMSGGEIVRTNSFSTSISASNGFFFEGGTLSADVALAGAGSLTKNGSGTFTLSGANTFTGATVVNAGTLNANASGALANTSNITVTGGSLLVGASNAIGDTVGIELAGGTLEFSGNVTDTIGALTLSANSVIDLGEGDVVAVFANLFMGNYTLAVHNWTGTTFWDGGRGNNPDQIYFSRALDGGELDRISFYSDFGSDFLGTGFQLGFGSGFQYQVIPVPEAETWMAAALLLAGAGVAWMRGRRRKSGNMDGQDQQDGVGGVGLGADAIR